MRNLNQNQKFINNFEKSLNYTTTLYLVLTYKCNLKCKYCPFPKLTKKKKEILMSSEVVMRGIDLWLEHIYDNFDEEKDYFIIFYGGEPLLNINALECGLKYIEKLKKKNKLPQKNLYTMVDTNGLLINNKIIRLFKKYNVLVTVGCDGPKKLNDCCRIDDKGKGTFEKVEKAFISLKKNKIKTFASVSITPYNVLKIKNFSRFFKKYKIDGFGFNILKADSLFYLSPKINLKKYYKNVANGIIDNFCKNKEKNYEHQIAKKFTAFYKNFPPLDCGGYGTQLVIQPDGNITNCPFLFNSLGNVKDRDKDFRIWTSSLIKKWRKRLPIYSKKCQNCRAINICGGGCPLTLRDAKRSIFEKDEAMCIFTKKVIHYFHTIKT